MTVEALQVTRMAGLRANGCPSAQHGEELGLGFLYIYIYIHYIQRL